MIDQRRLLCIHQNRLLRQCLVWILSTDDRFSHFEISELDRDSADFETVASRQPDVALLDLGLPQRRAVELTRQIRETLNADVILLVGTAAEDEQYQHELLLECVEAGAQGYVIEDSSLEELKQALESVIEGRVFCSSRLMQSMMQQLAGFSREARWRRKARPVDLTRRELEILTWIAEGLSNKEIAAKLVISTFTVKNHVHRILTKLQVDDRVAAVRRAVEESWL